MDENVIQEFANENSLDVRPLQPWHFRLMDEWGKYVLDVFIKRNKNGNIVKNTVHRWSNDKWYECRSPKDLLALISKK